MKHIMIVIAAFAAFAHSAYSQKSSDIGAFVGAAYYMGDVNPNKLFYKPGIAYGGIYRYNMNKRFAMRFTSTVLKLSGNDLDFDNEYQQLRKYSFSETIYDISLLFEFNFFPYHPLIDNVPITPYTVFGASMVIAPAPVSTMDNLGIPMGIGFKFNMGQTLSGGIEWQYRKTFTDNIDYLNDDTELRNTDLRGTSQTFSTLNKDWYSYCGAYIMIRLFRNAYTCRAYNFNSRTK